MNPRFGGPCQGIRNSIPELEKLGVSNEVVCLDDPNEPFLVGSPFIIHAIGPWKGLWWYSPKLIPWLLDNYERFDVIIIHGLWLFHSYAVTKAIQILKDRGQKHTPDVFIMPHGMLDPYFQNAFSRKLKALRNWLYWKLIERNVINSATGLLFTSETELQLARKAFSNYKPKREINIGYGIVTPPALSNTMQEAFLEKYPQLENSPFILFLGRIHEKKGVDLLINSYLMLASTHPNIKLPKLVISGPGLETNYGKKMQLKVAGNSLLNESILFTGMVLGDEKWGAFYSCEAFILPSHQENFGIAVAEAMACGKPVLISNQVNIWREIETLGGGIVKNNSLAGTEELLINWIKMPIQERQIMSKQARKVFNSYFTVELMAKRLAKALSN